MYTVIHNNKNFNIVFLVVRQRVSWYYYGNVSEYHGNVSTHTHSLRLVCVAADARPPTTAARVLLPVTQTNACCIIYSHFALADHVCVFVCACVRHSLQIN